MILRSTREAPQSMPVMMKGQTKARAQFILMLGTGLGLLLLYLSWWFENGRHTSLWTWLGFGVAVAYCLFQILGSWTLYAHAYRSNSRVSQPVE